MSITNTPSSQNASESGRPTLIKRTSSSSSKRFRESSITDFFARKPIAAPSTPSASPDDSGISTSTISNSIHGKENITAASSSQKPPNQTVALLKASSSPMTRNRSTGTHKTPVSSNNRASSPVEVSSGESVYSVKSQDSDIQVISDKDPDIQVISSKAAPRKAPIDLCSSPEPVMSKKKATSGAVFDQRSPEPPKASTSRLESPAKSSTLRVESSPSASKALRVLPQGSTSPAASRLAAPSRLDGIENAASPRRSPRLLSPEPQSVKKPRSSSKPPPSKPAMARKRSTPIVPLKPAIEPVSDRKRVIQREFSVEISLADHPGSSSRHVSSPPKAKPPSSPKRSSNKGKQRMDIDEEDVAVAEMLSPIKRKTPDAEDVDMAPASPLQTKEPTPPPKPKKLTRLPGESGREFGARLLASRKAASAAATPDPTSKDDEPSSKKLRLSDDMDSDDDLVDAGEAAKKASVNAGKAREAREEAARAAEERLNGPSASTSAKAPAPVSRRTGRGRKSQLDEVPEEEDPDTKSMLDEWAAGEFGGKGQFSLKALVKEKNLRVKKGYKSAAEVDALAAALGEDIGELEGGTQSKEELDRLRASKGSLTKMLGGGNKTNKLLDAVLDEEKEDEAVKQATLDARRFWTLCEAGQATELQPYTPPEASTFESTPFLDNVMDGLRRGLQDSLAYPCEIALSIGSWVDTYSVNTATSWLFELAVNPSTSRQLASPIMTTLLALIRESSTRIDQDAQSSLPIQLDSFRAALRILGGRSESVIPALSDKGKQSVEGQSGLVEEASVLVEASMRRPALVRLLRIAEEIATSGLWSAKPNDTATLAVTLCRMSIDPYSAAYRMPLENAIHALLHSLPADHMMLPLESLISLCANQNRQCQYEMVGILPHRTSADRLLRRWLAWALLTTRTSEVTSGACQHGPPIAPVLALFDSPTRDGPFYAQDDFDELTLYYSTNLLQVAVSDLWTDLIRILPEDGKSEGDQLRTDIVILHEKLLKTDAGIKVTARTNNPLRNKARNQVTRIAHSLYHQHRTADSSANTAKNAAGISKPKGQQKLNAFFAPTAGSSGAAAADQAPSAEQGVNGTGKEEEDLPNV